jgi:hypothetical protein
MALRTYYLDNRAYTYTSALNIINDYNSTKETFAGLGKALAEVGLAVVAGFGAGWLSNMLIADSGLITGGVAYISGLYYAFGYQTHHTASYAPTVVTGAELVNALNELASLSVWSPYYDRNKAVITNKLFAHQYTQIPLTIDDVKWNEWPGAVLNARKEDIYVHKNASVDVYLHNDTSSLIDESAMEFLIDNFI